MVNSCSWVPGLLLWATLPFVSFSGVLNFFNSLLILHDGCQTRERHTIVLGATGKVLPQSKNYLKPPKYQKKPQKSGCSSKHSGRSSYLHRSAFLGRNSTFLHQTKCIRRIFFFCQCTGARISHRTAFSGGCKRSRT